MRKERDLRKNHWGKPSKEGQGFPPHYFVQVSTSLAKKNHCCSQTRTTYHRVTVRVDRPIEKRKEKYHKISEKHSDRGETAGPVNESRLAHHSTEIMRGKSWEGKRTRATGVFKSNSRHGLTLVRSIGYFHQASRKQ